MRGCERIKIKALLPKDTGISDCTASAYPRFAERPVVDVPMPRKLLGAQLVSGRGGLCNRAQSPQGLMRGPGVRETRPGSQTDARAWLCVFQKTKDRFLEVKMESSRQRFFHLMSDVAYTEVSGSGPCGGAGAAHRVRSVS